MGLVDYNFSCGVCGASYSRAIANSYSEFYFNQDVRAIGGGIVFANHAPIEWPLRNSAPELCFECTEAVAETLRERVGINQ